MVQCFLIVVNLHPRLKCNGLTLNYIHLYLFIFVLFKTNINWKIIYKNIGAYIIANDPKWIQLFQ